ncbi:hypothetical protein WG908_03260 [Sphingobium sp. AN641]|uniref:hypothetical protein n=1 Tax=Sphingobium sp. AN641 TaxID=3133443 RepID=UPI0030C4D83E
MEGSSSRSPFGENVLLQEYLRLCNDIRSIESSGDRVLSIAVALLGLVATTGIVQKADAVFILLPVAIIGVLMYAMTVYVWIFSMGGYKSHLEDLINSSIGEKILLWEKIVPRRDKYNLARVALVSIYILVTGAIMGLCVLKVSEAYGLWLGRGIATIGIFGLFILIIAWHKMKKVGLASYLAAQDLHGKSEDVDEDM